MSSDYAEGTSGDVWQITGIATNVLTVTRLTGTDSTYPAGTLVNVAVEAYFTDDTMTEENVMTVLYKTGLEFEEKA